MFTKTLILTIKIIGDALCNIFFIHLTFSFFIYFFFLDSQTLEEEEA